MQPSISKLHLTTQLPFALFLVRDDGDCSPKTSGGPSLPMPGVVALPSYSEQFPIFLIYCPFPTMKLSHRHWAAVTVLLTVTAFKSIA
uniref:Uncharacterized protein n=1 Tax=Podarcis muralis TaxID=64176 RepID=A0A670KLB3_PODMU